MLKCHSTSINDKDIPGVVSLVINISNCRLKCNGCNARELWADTGLYLTNSKLEGLISPIIKSISCVLFMGGDIAPDEVNHLASFIRQQYPALQIGWYSGRKEVSIFTDYRNFDYIKLGPYMKERGGLHSKTTNQRLYKVTIAGLQDITNLFWN